MLLFSQFWLNVTGFMKSLSIYLFYEKLSSILLTTTLTDGPFRKTRFF